ncbi:hypothetical protein LTR53_011399 [Teratosphaeriaceae sp. CCFEE 6253]|nr:hypothetical protein LTR53_011399 [Teratosphaeriaceae sp. CCFEE 6253]
MGEVTTLPYHTANTNPSVDPTDRNLTSTFHGPVYSKRRMMVVLEIYGQDMFCLPLYAWSGKGVETKPEWLQREYVCMTNSTDTDFVNHGIYKPIVIENNRYPMDPKTTIVLTGGTRVGCNEDIGRGVGRVTRKSCLHLVNLHRKLCDEAQKQPWR